VRDVILAGGDTSGYGGVSQALTEKQDGRERGRRGMEAEYGRELLEEMARRRGENGV
jgi:hypothetical protein